MFRGVRGSGGPSKGGVSAVLGGRGLMNESGSPCQDSRLQC